MIKTNYSNLIIPEGKYEVVMINGGYDETDAGTRYFANPLFIREDVDQPCKGRTLYDNIWLSSEKATAWKVNGISHAVGIEEGTEYKDVEEWYGAVNLLPMKVTVSHDTYKGKVSARVAKYEPSEHMQEYDAETYMKMQQVTSEDAPF